MRFLSLSFLVSVLVSLAGCSSCTSQVPCTANRDCGDGQLCAAGDDGSFCVPAGEEGEGEGEGEGEPTVTLRLVSGVLEGDEQLDVTLEWTLVAVTGCELQADGVDTGTDLVGQSSATRIIDESQALQIVCSQAESEALAFVVHDVSEIGGPAAATVGATVTLTFTVDGVTSCAVSTDGDDTALSQPVITGNDGSFTDIADADKSYTLTCAGSEGDITRSFLLNVLTVDVIVPLPAIVTYGDSLSFAVSVDPPATCVLVSSAQDGSDRRAEPGAAFEIDGDTRTVTLANVTSSRRYLVECGIDSASAASAQFSVFVRPRAVSLDARIVDIENLNGAAATLELLVNVAGRETGGPCVIQGGTNWIAAPGSSVLIASGPDVAVYRVACFASGEDTTPSEVGGVRVLWRDATEADLALLASTRFAMRGINIQGVAPASIDTGQLEQVGGDFLVVNVTFDADDLIVAAPNLRDVGGTVSFGAPFVELPRLRSISLPVLNSASRLWISGHLLTSFSAPSLTVVDDGGASMFAGVGIVRCDQLLTIDLPTLQSARSLSISGNPVAQRATAPRLEYLTTGALFLNSLSGLTTLELPELIDVGGSIDIYDVGLAEIVMPDLRSVGSHTGSGDVNIRGNPALVELSFPQLTASDSAGQFSVTANSLLSCEEIAGVYCPLVSRDSAPSVENNLSATCPDVNSGC